ncbi:MAG TPA: hypothetical protein VJ456_19210 [Acidimicrobiia bacterium]|nr:hypothetical protein [Acidimicrobiia bacterium]
MGKPMFGTPGVNTFVRASRKLAQLTRRPQPAFDAEWVDHLLVGVHRRVKLKDVKAAPHGMYFREPLSQTTPLDSSWVRVDPVA